MMRPLRKSSEKQIFKSINFENIPKRNKNLVTLLSYSKTDDTYSRVSKSP